MKIFESIQEFFKITQSQSDLCLIFRSENIICSISVCNMPCSSNLCQCYNICNLIDDIEMPYHEQNCHFFKNEMRKFSKNGRHRGQFEFWITQIWQQLFDRLNGIHFLPAEFAVRICIWYVHVEICIR